MVLTWKANFRLLVCGDVCYSTANSLNPLRLDVFLHHMHKWSDHLNGFSSLGTSNLCVSLPDIKLCFLRVCVCWYGAG